MADFKVKVVKNIGRESLEEFGAPGTVHEIKYGTLVHEDREWSNNHMGIHSVEELNRILGNSPTFNTVFEKVEG
jgi:hypothetical protein